MTRLKVLQLAVAWASFGAAGLVLATDVPGPHRPGPARDRLELDSTAIKGNRELPRVMSIVPWKAAEPPAGPDRPLGSLIEEVLAPVDRDEFRREITYFRDLTSQSSDRTSSGVKDQ